MAAGIDSELVGKPVYFVRPSSVIQKELVAELVRREFEVMLVPDPTLALAFFRRHSDCLAFLNIDDGLDEADWESLVRQIQEDPGLTQVRLGILTYNPDPELAQKYLLDLGVPCGYITLGLGLEASTATIVKVLEANEARGRRKFVRVHLDDRPGFNWKDGETLVEGQIVDLSSAGMACLLPEDRAIPLHAVLPALQLKLRGRLCLVEGVVMGSRPNPEGPGRVYVVLFGPKTEALQKEKIRQFLWDTQQARVEDELRVLAR